jgi:hypothetical protein
MVRMVTSTKFLDDLHSSSLAENDYRRVATDKKPDKIILSSYEGVA